MAEVKFGYLICTITQVCHEAMVDGADGTKEGDINIEGQLRKDK